jgi:hypothetical protein
MWNRPWLVWLIVVPLALILGYFLATPDDYVSLGLVGIIVCTLFIPVLLRWHYPILIFSWNALLIPFFVPGRLHLWMFMAFISFGIAVLRRTINKDASFLKASSVTYPLLFLGAVVLLTAKFTGGIGFAALGSGSVGGKKYFFIYSAIVGYFALISQPIPKNRAKFYTGLFFLSGLTAILSNLIYMAGPSFYFLYALIPVELAVDQALASQAGEGLVRVLGLTFGGMAIFCILLARYGIRGILDLHKPWRMALLLAAGFATLLAGFRSSVVTFALVFALLFFIERLHRTRWLPITIAGLVVIGAALFPFIKKMPFSVQRALSVLPIEVDPAARMSAQGSSEWRLEMWKMMTPQIPQYFWKGKGYALNPTDMYLTDQAILRGFVHTSEGALVAGDYHNGPLSLIIPFGIFGTLGFIWFLAAGLIALYRNYRYGDLELQRVNAFLFAFFLAKTIFFFTVFGAINSDLPVFVGLIGFGISLNAGIRQKKPATRKAQESRAENTLLAPA